MSADAYIQQINALLRGGDRTAARDLCDTALAAHKDDFRLHALMADLQQSANDFDGALESFDRAIALAPNNLALRNNFGLALTFAGDFSRAEDQFRAAISIKPDFAPAYFNLAQSLKLTSHDPLIDSLEHLKRDSRQDSVSLSLIGYALGKFYDDIGEWDRAFKNFDEANKRTSKRYDIGETLSFFAATKSVFTTALIETHAHSGIDDPRSIFIIGMPRSGSSLLEDLLARFEGVVGLGEREDLSYIIDAIAQSHGAYPQSLSKIAPGELGRFAVDYTKTIEGFAPNARRFVDKNLLHYQAAGLLRMMLPQAALLHTRRDAIDTCLSCYFQRFNRAFEYTFDLTNLGREYAGYADLMNHWEMVMPDKIITIDYEKMVNDRDAAIARIAKAISLETDSANLDAAADRHLTTASSWQARQPIYGSSVQRWRNYEKHLGPLFKALDEGGFQYDPG